MKRIFITYGDEKFIEAKRKIIEEARQTGEFDEVMSYGYDDLTDELKNSKIIKEPRGGGLWSWKPDVIWSTMQNAGDGDIIVYCDSGCTVQKSNEWKWYWKKLEHHDIIAQRILMRNDHYTRKELIDKYIETNGQGWPLCYQYQATVVVAVGDFTRKFVKEWRDIMIQQSHLAMDVTPQERPGQHSTLVENRHDQAVYSSLIYKYLRIPEYRDRIFTCWEKIEDCTLFRKQAIRATRLRLGQNESVKLHLKRIYKRFFKHYILIPFVIAPRQWWYNKK